MAEPRKPRVIRTRKPVTGATPVVPASETSVSAVAGSAVTGSAAATGTVRGTSEKVAMLPVPLEETKPAFRVPRPKAVAVPHRKAKGTQASGDSESNNDLRAQPKATKTVSVPTGAGKKAAAAQAVQTKSVPKKFVTGQKAADEKSGPKTSSDSAVRGSAARGNSVPRGPGAQAHVGAEAKVLAFPMPSHKRRRRTVLFSVAGIVAVLALVMGIALYSPALSVRTIEFEGNKLVSEDTLQLALAPVMSRPLPQVTGADVSSLLEPVVQVKSSRIEARPPSTLVVHVVERVPVALLKNGSVYSLVDQDGVELGTTKDPAKAGLPLIDGGKAAIGKDTFQAMTGVLATLPTSILSQLANASAKSRDAVELKLIDGRSVIWGNASDMELKAQVLEALLNSPLPTVPEGKPAPVPAKVFDVSAPRHPVTR